MLHRLSVSVRTGAVQIDRELFNQMNCGKLWLQKFKITQIVENDMVIKNLHTKFTYQILIQFLSVQNDCITD